MNLFGDPSPGPRERLAAQAREVAAGYRALEAAFRSPLPAELPHSSDEELRIGTGEGRVRVEGGGVVVQSLRDLEASVARLSREAALFGGQAPAGSVESAAAVRDAILAIADAIEAEPQASPALALNARRKASAAERCARGALEATFSIEGPQALKARSTARGLSEAAELAERAAAAMLEAVTEGT